MEKILLFIPMYNCEKQIIRVLTQLNGEIAQYISEVIIVNNRSTDNSENVVIQYLEGGKFPLAVTLLRNHQNYNLGGSHKVAFNYAVKNGFDYVIVLHGDDQGKIDDIIPLLKSGDYHNFDCCLGARFMKGSKLTGYSTFRKIGNICYNMLFSVACKSVIYDLGSGLNLYKTKMLRKPFFLGFPDSLVFNCYMLLANSYYDYKYLFFPISWREDDQISNVKLFSQATTTFKIAVGYFFSNKKQHMEKDYRNNKISEYKTEIVKIYDKVI